MHYVGNINHFVCIVISMSLDAQKLSSAIDAVEDLELTVDASSGDAVEHLLFIPTLKRIKLLVVSDRLTKALTLVSVGPDCSV